MVTSIISDGHQIDSGQRDRPAQPRPRPQSTAIVEICRKHKNKINIPLRAQWAGAEVSTVAADCCDTQQIMDTPYQQQISAAGYYTQTGLLSKLITLLLTKLPRKFKLNKRI